MIRVVNLRTFLVTVAVVYLGYMTLRNMFLFTLILMRHAFTADFGWLLQTGRYIVASRSIPAHDIYSWTAPERDWVLYQWLFEVVVAIGEHLVGLEPMIRATIVLLLAIYVFLPAAGGVPARVPLFLTLMISLTTMYITSVNLSLRPMVPTTVFLAVQFVLLRYWRRGDVGLPAAVSVLAPIYLAWGNMHTGVVLGLVSLALMAAADALERRGTYRFEPPDPDVEGRPAPARDYAILIAVCFAASLVNPYGFGIYPYIVELSLKHELNSWIIELQPPKLIDARTQLFLVLAVAAAALLIRARRVYPLHEIAHLAVFTAVTFTALRFVVWAGLLYALILPKALYQAWFPARDSYPLVSAIVRCLERGRGLYLAAAAAFAVAFAAIFAGDIQPLRPGDCTYMARGIVAYDVAKRPGDRLFNDPAMGSCLLFAYPNTKVFIDTRFDFYDERFAVRTLKTLRMEGDWQGWLRQWGVNAFLLRKPWPLAEWVVSRDNAHIVYQDKNVVVVQF